MFTRIRPYNVPSQIVDQIISLIAAGKLSPGDKLPPERELSEALGVGRQAVREALGRLQAMGVIRVRKSQGSFVQFLTPEALRQPLSGALEQEVRGVLNFLDVRKWLEGMSAAEAALRATEDELREIEATLPRLDAAAGRMDREALDESDIAFHVAIVTATHNPLIVHLLDTFRSLMRSSHELRTMILESSDFQAVCDEHRAVAEAIAARAPARARDAMMRHVEMVRARVERRFGEEAARQADGHGGATRGLGA